MKLGGGYSFRTKDLVAVSLLNGQNILPMLYCRLACYRLNVMEKKKDLKHAATIVKF